MTERDRGGGGAGRIDIINESHGVADELLIEECSGHAADHSDRALELLPDDHDCEVGEWVTAVDGEVVSVGHSHPHRVHITD